MISNNQEEEFESEEYDTEEEEDVNTDSITDSMVVSEKAKPQYEEELKHNESLPATEETLDTAQNQTPTKDAPSKETIKAQSNMMQMQLGANFLNDLMNQQFKPKINFKAEEKKIQKLNSLYDRLRIKRDELYLINGQMKALIDGTKVKNFIRESMIGKVLEDTEIKMKLI